jgi:hypothetical protein
LEGKLDAHFIGANANEIVMPVLSGPAFSPERPCDGVKQRALAISVFAG